MYDIGQIPSQLDPSFSLVCSRNGSNSEQESDKSQDIPVFGRKKPQIWTDFEDKRLLQGVNMYGTDSWNVVACFVGNGRTKSQCSQRWYRGLDPRINKESWNKSEDNNLLSLVEKLGTKSWIKIASYFPDRCDVQCRYRYTQLSKKHNIEQPPKIIEYQYMTKKYQTIPSIWSLLNNV